MIYLTGDTHIPTDIKKLNSKNFKEGRHLTKNDYIIIVGDFGLVWKNIQDKLERYWLDWFTNIKKFTILFVDGNHENHKRLFSNIIDPDKIGSEEYKLENKFGDVVGKLSDSVYHLRRGKVYSIENNKFFVMGGAYSIDKSNRTENISWWREEEPNVTELYHGLDNLQLHNNYVDYILGHNAPGSIIMKYVDRYYKQDSVSRYFDHIINIVQFKKFFCGHWHIDDVYGKYNFLYQNIVKL